MVCIGLRLAVPQHQSHELLFHSRFLILVLTSDTGVYSISSCSTSVPSPCDWMPAFANALACAAPSSFDGSIVIDVLGGTCEAFWAAILAASTLFACQ